MRQTKPFISYRYVSQKSGLKSSGFISWVVMGKKNVSVDLATRIASVLKLSKRESNYFELLVLHNQAKSTEQRQLFFDRMLAFRSTHATVLERDRDQYYSQWFYSAIRELVAITEISDEQQVCALLNPPISRSDAKTALDLLLRLGLIRRTDKNIFERVDQAITSGKSINTALIHSFQITTMQMAQSALHRINKEERDISTVTLSCNSKDLEKIRERISQMRLEISAIACASTDANQVFQLNTQFFPLSKPASRRN
jgi:uncharacterized protein (TIGR02147 family)